MCPLHTNTSSLLPCAACCWGPVQVRHGAGWPTQRDTEGAHLRRNWPFPARLQVLTSPQVSPHPCSAAWAPNTGRNPEFTTGTDSCSPCSRVECPSWEPLQAVKQPVSVTALKTPDSFVLNLAHRGHDRIFYIWLLWSRGSSPLYKPSIWTGSFKLNHPE